MTGIALTMPVAVATAAALVTPLPVRQPAWRIILDGRDVSRDIGPMVTSIEYVDHAHGKSDEITIEVENSDLRWLNAWYPTKGDTIELHVGYAGELLLPCGRFEIDELEASGPPDVLRIKALAAGMLPAVRTKRSAGYDGQTLREIAEKIAQRHNFTLLGDIEPLTLPRVTQHRETDLAFLTRVAERYGYVFSLRDRALTFYRVGTLETTGAVATIARTECDRYRFPDKTHQVYRACVVSYQDPVTKSVIMGTAADAKITTGDTLRITERVESVSLAERRAREELRAANKQQRTGTIVRAGDPRLAAGVTVKTAGFGVADGTYLIASSRHTLTRDQGYTTEAELTSA